MVDKMNIISSQIKFREKFRENENKYQWTMPPGIISGNRIPHHTFERSFLRVVNQYSWDSGSGAKGDIYLSQGQELIEELSQVILQFNFILKNQTIFYDANLYVSEITKSSQSLEKLLNLLSHKINTLIITLIPNNLKDCVKIIGSYLIDNVNLI